MTTYNTEYGPIFYDNSGNDHRVNIVDFSPLFPKRHEAVKLQKPALAAFQAAEKRVGKAVAATHHFTKFKSRAIQVTGSWRSFDLQSSLYHSDSHRYASPYTSGHVQAIAIDVSTDFEFFGLAHHALIAEGWKQARPDEPWHYSFGPAV